MYVCASCAGAYRFHSMSSKEAGMRDWEDEVYDDDVMESEYNDLDEGFSSWNDYISYKYY